MITKTNQTKIYKNEVIRDAIRLIRQGESAFVYSKIDIMQINKIMGEDNLMIIQMSPVEANIRFEYNGELFIVSYNERILGTMAYAMEKLFILRDMGFKISNPDKKYIKSSLSKTEVEAFRETVISIAKKDAMGKVFISKTITNNKL